MAVMSLMHFVAYYENYILGGSSMKKRKVFVPHLIVLAVIVLLLTGCDGSYADTRATRQVGNTLSTNQPTPTDIEYSLERFNLIRRAYWVNGEREKAMMVE